MIRVVLSPEVDRFIAGLPEPEKTLTKAEILNLREPRVLLDARPLPGASPDWRIATIAGLFEVTLRPMSREETAARGYTDRALMVATIDRTEDLRAEGGRHLDEDDDEPET